MKRTLKLFFLLGGIALFTVGCQLPFTKKIVTFPLLEKSPAKVAQLNKEKTAAITASHIEMTADITGTSAGASSTGDLSGTLTLKADSDVPGKKMQGSVTGTIKVANASYNFGVDLRSLNDVFYFQLTALPSLPGAASDVFSGITNVWYRVDPAALQKDLSDSLGGLLPGTAGTNVNLNTNGNSNSNNDVTTNSNANVNSQTNQNTNAALNVNKQKEILNRITDLAKNANIYSLGERLADEKVTGVNCYRYKIAINQTELKKLLEEIMSAESDLMQGVAGPSVVSTEGDVTQGVTSGLFSVNQNEAVDEAMKILKDMTGEIWIGKKDFLTHKITLNLATTQTGQTLTVKMSLVSSNFNQPVNVEIPADSKNFTDLLQNVMTIFFGMLPADTSNLTDSSARATGLTDDEKQMAQLGSIKSALALYHAKNSSYPAQLSAAKAFIDTSCTDVGGSGYACQLLNNFVTVDVNTGQAYAYKTAGNSFELTYTMLSGQGALYASGKNTMTPDSRSLEAYPKGEPDTDNDGLTDDEEFRFKTDDLEKDTDGDSFLDGLEVMNGFNPLGEGKLASLPVTIEARLLQ